MTNPNLITQDTPWRGFTSAELEERLLSSRGLTNDATTGRTIATTGETTAAKDHLKRSFDLLNARYPSVFSVRRYEFSWTSGDHSIALPANIMAVLGVTWKGLSLRKMTREDYYRALRSDDEGGDVGASDDPVYFRMTGFSDEDANSDPGDRDWRLAMRLHPAPSSSEVVVVEYLALSSDHTSVGADPIPLFPFMQGWVLERSRELWSAENGDSSIQKVAEGERIKHETDIDRWLEAQAPAASRLTWRYPNVTRRRGGRYR